MKRVSVSRHVLLFLSLFSLATLPLFLQGCPSEICNDSKPCPEGQTCSADKLCVQIDEKTDGGTEKTPTENNAEQPLPEGQEPVVTPEDGGNDQQPDESGVTCQEGCFDPKCLNGGGIVAGVGVPIGEACRWRSSAPLRSCVAGATCAATGLGQRSYCYKAKTQVDRCANSSLEDTIDGSPLLPEGAVCNEAGQAKACQDGLSCLNFGHSNTGYCYRTCNADSDCSGGLKCEDADGTKVCGGKKIPFRGQCSLNGSNLPCQDGLRCVLSDPFGAGFCERQCQNDLQCTGGEQCTTVPPTSCADDACRSQTTRVCYADGLRLGALCKSTGAQITPCELGLVCVANGFEDRGYCYLPCRPEANTCPNNERCLPQGAGLPSVCGVAKGENDTCNNTVQEFCDPSARDGQGNPVQLTCIITDEERSAGVCRKVCKDLFDCSGGLVCRALGADTNFCLPRVDPGPRCIFQSCDAGATETNCLSGLVCQNGQCVRECTRATQEQDCDYPGGETCEIAFGQAKGLCLPPRIVSQPGQICNNTNLRCDPSKNLRCLGVSQDRSVCVQVCDRNKGKDNNPDCQAQETCETSGNLGFHFCRKQSQIADRCDGGEVCVGEKNTCINFSDIGGYCLGLCRTCKNNSDTDANNQEECGGERCLQLSGSIEVNGVSYNGVCLPKRPKEAKQGEVCDGSDGSGDAGYFKSRDCQDGLTCLGGGAAATCYKNCDPCTSTGAGTNWVNSVCEGNDKRCVSLSAGGVLTGTAVCINQGGEATLEAGERCPQGGKTCKEGVRCVLFSNDPEASALCVTTCDPNLPSNPECNGASCALLTDGSGVCRPIPPATKKLGENCLGSTGAPDYDNCVPEQDNKPIICARAPFIGQRRTCQVECQLLPGVEGKSIKDNADCKKYNLNNHLCLPASASEPSRGACLEVCNVTDRLRCKSSSCTYGVCREISIGTVGDCNNATKEQECQDRGGTCVDNTCIVTACN